MWNPPVRNPADLARTIPPAQQVVINPMLTVTRVVRTAEILDANRVADLDMGMPAQQPAGNQTVRPPRTGTGESSGSPHAAYILLTGLLLTSATALGLAFGQRVSRRRT